MSKPHLARSRSLLGSMRRRARPVSAPIGMAESGVTLVGGGSLPDLPGSSDLPDALEEVVNEEGVATNRRQPAQITIWLFLPDRAPAAISIEEVAEAVTNENAFVWVNAAAYDQADLRGIAAALGIHRNITHAMLSAWHRPWLAVYADYFFVSATIAHLDPAQYRINAGALDLCVGRHFLFSAHRVDLPFFERMQARALQSPDLVQLAPTFLLYVVLDELLAYFEELNRHLQSESEFLEERALRDTSDTFLEDLLRFKRYTFALTELVDQHREVFAAFFRPDFTWVTGEEVEGYYRDLQARLAHLLAMLGSAKEAVNGAFTIYVSQMSHRTNQIIKVLTMVSTLLLPATLLIALFGTTLHSLAPRLGVIWFVVMLISIMFMSGVILWVFRRRQWIAPRSPYQKTANGSEAT